MFGRKSLKNEMSILYNQLEKLNKKIQSNNIHELIYILGNKKEIMKRNFIAGIFRGVGIGIGVTLITAILIIILNRIVALNIPIIGKYISDIVDVVEKSR